MSDNLARILTETAERLPEQTAFKLDDVELNYSMLDEGSARVAGLLKSKGLEPGDRVGLMLPNVPYFPAIY
ncbi:MAG TPA: AMP-binding protein, partial [Thermoleophilaceae bacterium]|nr:AMP-binding protein [Thermoleophilaceae bacterium]